MARSSLRLAAMVIVALALAGCERAESYRYKLTLAVNTPDGLKRHSSVVEVLFREVSIPARGTMHKLRGEALYLDLGSGARPLIALLTCRPPLKHREEPHWTRDAGPNDNLLTPLYGEALQGNILDYVRRIARMRGPRQITPADLPDLVTFADMSDPKSVIKVDPNDLKASLGQNTTWHEITLEITDEPITTGIATKLTWLPKYFDQNLRLDGSNHGAKIELASILSWSDFDQSSDREKDKKQDWVDGLLGVIRIATRL
jgi:hypothetical protein